MTVRQTVGMSMIALMLSMATFVSAQSDVADAAMDRDQEAVRSLLDERAADIGLTVDRLNEFLDFVNARQGDGASAIHWAAYHQNHELAEVLIRAGIDVTAKNRNGSTPLWLASTNGDAAMIETLLNAGADANEQLPLGRTPLMLVSRTGNLEAVKRLVDNGADLNARDSQIGTTPLMWAAQEGHAEIISFLIDQGADFAATSNPVERGQRTAALGKSGDPRNAVRAQVEAILANQQSPDLDVLRAVSGLPGQLSREAAAEVAAEAFRALTSQDGNAAASVDEAAPEANNAGNAQPAGFGRRGRPPTPPEGGEFTSLVYAARANSLDSVRVLLEAGADVNQVTNYGWSPLLVASQNRYYELAKFLIVNGADVNIANNGGWTNLYLATDNRNVEGGDYPTRLPDIDHLEYIEFLLDEGANVNARLIESTETRTVFTNQWLDENGATAFLRASQSGDIDLMRILLEHGADPSISTELNVTPLAVAAGIGWVEGVTSEWSVEQTVEAVQLLLDLGIDPNVQAETGRVALHGAGHKGATEVVRLLVANGAQMDVRDYGNTDNRGSAELAAHTWLPVDYADGLVRVGVQSAIAHPETGIVFRELMEEAGLVPPPVGRTLNSICITEACDLFPLELR